MHRKQKFDARMGRDEQYFRSRTTFYQQTNSSIHKEPISDIEAPSLTWHRSFLIPKHRKNDRAAAHSKEPETEHRFAPSDVKNHLDTVLMVLIRGLKSRRAKVKTLPFAHKTMILFSRLVREDVDDLVDVTQNPGPLCGTLDAGERTFILETDWKHDGHDWNISMRFQVLTNIFNITIIASPKDIDLLRINTSYDFARWTNGFWLRFSAYIQSFEDFHESIFAPIFSAEFADFRGIIFPCRLLEFGTGIQPPSEQFPDWGPAVAKKLTPLIATSNRYECSVSYMLDRRAVHITALGPQPLGLSRYEKRPSKYITCVHTHNANGQQIVGQRQLGRLVDRMHFLGTMRLASILDLSLMEEASFALSKIDGSKKEARKQILAYEEQEDNAPDAQKALEKLRQKMNLIASDFLESSAAGVGLTFRIESSRYYISQFRQNLKALRLSRVEGFQPYDQFVERRLGVTFESIDRLGVRYDRALKEMEGIDQSFASAQTRYTGVTIA